MEGIPALQWWDCVVETCSHSDAKGAKPHDKNESRMNLLYARAYWGVPTPWL